ncbi:hypothetical protein OsI_19450 [Oryza sativa Indica Group]|jgi:hypothetical protein|uniref:Uncharacterized protein n=2 Tax=Oryza TaxID=4527 RepID=B8AWL1_ORYSI|nr:hypothetical protein OsI_19450 [Oryza sativa Indica Group]
MALVVLYQENNKGEQILDKPGLEREWSGVEERKVLGSEGCAAALAWLRSSGARLPVKGLRQMAAPRREADDGGPSAYGSAMTPGGRRSRGGTTTEVKGTATAANGGGAAQPAACTRCLVAALHEMGVAVSGRDGG